MNHDILKKVKEVIVNSIGNDLTVESLPDDLQLVGNILDSMSVTNLILALEDYFSFTFNDDELSAETFETVHTLTQFVEHKVSR